VLSAATAIDVQDRTSVDVHNHLMAWDVFTLPAHKQGLIHRSVDEVGNAVLTLLYGTKEIVFDDASFFGFAEGLIRQSHFTGNEAVSWAAGKTWPDIQPLLEALLDDGILIRGKFSDQNTAQVGLCPAPLPAGTCPFARNWSEGGRLMAELTGRELEIGHLEQVVPIFRIAHAALDADGRQVGEANVFPKALRLNISTQWAACNYRGTRYQTGKPMNVTALRTMRAHWPQMMAILPRVRAAYLERFPEARFGWTVGHIERLATCVLALPTMMLMRAENPIETGSLHPALSSVFRVTDGLRMVMHQMLFVPVGEPALDPDAPMDASEILSYADRNYSFHSEHGVCAGPPQMIREFLAAILDGQLPKSVTAISFNPQVEDALANLDLALDYALAGLQVYGSIFSIWPAMMRCYAELAMALAATEYGQRFAQHVERLEQATYLGTEERRRHRDIVYDDMYSQCTFGLSGQKPAEEMSSRLTNALLVGDADLVRRLSLKVPEEAAHSIARFTLSVNTFLTVAAEAQGTINTLLARRQPSTAASLTDIDLHNLLQGSDVRHIPLLTDELREVFGLGIDITKEGILVEA
jgi:hypothetical protein